MYAHLTGGRRNVEEIAKDVGVNVTRVNSSTFNLEKLVFSDTKLCFRTNVAANVIDDISEHGGGADGTEDSKSKTEDQGQAERSE
ncbi:hypothetical protein FGB62_19g280 [Gracilaria domingensis]|nr:hypothetical protein FGB62_19g280 [Gracilaria domingensis]